MTLVEAAILMLATWRLTSLVVNEHGPFSVFERLRHLAGVRYDEYGARDSNRLFGRLLICVWCASVWVGAALWAAYTLAPVGTVWACLPAALSAGAILIDHGLRTD